MIPVKGYAVPKEKAPLEPFKFERRELKPNDVLIDIHYCGICHSDIHQARNEWNGSVFPMVPGHEIVGQVSRVGANVKKYKAEDTVGVGCMVNSCKKCSSCDEGLEQYCLNGFVGTYNGYEKDGDHKTPTYGGYSTQIVVDQDFVLKVPKSIPLDQAAPLLCAGITTYSPLKHWGAGPGKKVAVMGLGGLGHMAVKLAAAMGAEVTVLTTTDKKREDALRFGAKNIAGTLDPATFTKFAGQFDLIINTVSAPHDLNKYIGLLRREGTMVLLGVPEKSEPLSSFALIGGRRAVAGSLIGGIKETQEMLDFCAEKGLASDVEVIPASKINEAFERTLKGDVRYRFVIDINSIR